MIIKVILGAFTPTSIGVVRTIMVILITPGKHIIPDHHHAKHGKAEDHCFLKKGFFHLTEGLLVLKTNS
jgi:hypothetical protein